MPDEHLVRVNGKEQRVPSGTTVAELLRLLGYPAKIVLVELNQEVLPRRDWAERQLKPGDRLELLRVVAGG
jgi:sulfur carrier protein